MSWQATRWAKQTRGHRSPGEKLLLMTLADYADTEKSQAYPSIAQLVEDCGMSARTVISSLQELCKRGFLQRLARGNQFQPSVYQVLVQSSADVSAAAAPPHEEHVQRAASVSATSDMANLIEESIEESNTTVAVSADGAPTPPQAEWHTVFHSIDGNLACIGDPEATRRCVTLQKWIDEELPDGLALETAKDMRDVLAWDPTHKRPWHYEKAGGGEGRYSDLWLTMRRWAKRRRDQPQQPSWNGARASPNRGEHTPEEYAQAKREYDERVRRAQQETPA